MHDLLRQHRFSYKYIRSIGGKDGVLLSLQNYLMYLLSGISNKIMYDMQSVYTLRRSSDRIVISFSSFWYYILRSSYVSHPVCRPLDYTVWYTNWNRAAISHLPVHEPTLLYIAIQASSWTRIQPLTFTISWLARSFHRPPSLGSRLLNTCQTNINKEVSRGSNNQKITA